MPGPTPAKEKAGKFEAGSAGEDVFVLRKPDQAFTPALYRQPEHKRREMLNIEFRTAEGLRNSKFSIRYSDGLKSCKDIYCTRGLFYRLRSAPFEQLATAKPPALPEHTCFLGRACTQPVFQEIRVSPFLLYLHQGPVCPRPREVPARTDAG